MLSEKGKYSAGWEVSTSKVDWSAIRQYPLREKIGSPELFVGRAQEFRLLQKWLDNIPKQLSKSRVILARRKSGKTAFVQRIFNKQFPEEIVPPAFLSLGGFTDEALAFCAGQGIGVAEGIRWQLETGLT